MDCNFNLGRSWFCQIRGDKLLFREYTSEDSEIGAWSYMSTYTSYRSIWWLHSDAVSLFPDYIVENYAEERCLFLPVLWPAQHSYDPRSNNATENFYSHYNCLFYKSTPLIHEVISQILNIKYESDLKLNSIIRSKWNIHCSWSVKKYKFLQDTIC